MESLKISCLPLWIVIYVHCMNSDNEVGLFVELQTSGIRTLPCPSPNQILNKFMPDIITSEVVAYLAIVGTMLGIFLPMFRYMVKVFREEIGLLREQVGRLEKRVGHLEERVGRLEDRVERLEERMTDFETRVMEKFDRSDERLFVLNGQVQKLVGRILGLEESTQEELVALDKNIF